jgi:glycosyltransferase involved in cell wall biosynthesis
LATATHFEVGRDEIGSDVVPDDSSSRSLIRCIGRVRIRCVTSVILPQGNRVDIDTLVDQIASSNGVLDAVKAMRPLAEAARRAEPLTAVQALSRLAEEHRADPLGAYVAIFALAGVESLDVQARLLDLMESGDVAMRQHVAWAMSRRRPIPSAVNHLARMAGEGGFSTMMAELALEAWLTEVPELSWRAGRDMADRMIWLSEKPAKKPNRAGRAAGMRIAQVLMQGKVDSSLTAAASGDGGGLITLQVGLTRELAGHDSISEVHLVTRAFHGDSPVFARRSEPIGERGFVSRIRFGPREYLSRDEMWAHRAALERELRSFLAENGPFDALHLRFADVGTFAASRIADDLDIPLVFTLAPDPHSVIAAAEASGDLTRENFAEVEQSSHFLFRAWLVDHMLDRADRLALLPRRDQRDQFLDLLNVDIAASDRFAVIPEGVDFALAEEAASEVLAIQEGGPVPEVISELEAAIRAMPTSRQGLPLLLSAGRFSTVKGFDRIVAAWTGDASISSRFNLVIVGGNLDNPSAEEGTVRRRIESQAGDAEGLILLGGRSHREVAMLMAAAAHGLPGTVAGDGVYVCASAKEEFGLAIVEALAAGLPVVAPRVGGPATYVDHEFTGYLADTMDVDDISRGIHWAEGSRSSELRSDAARRMVRSEYSLSSMASELVEIYEMGPSEATAS